MRPEKPAYTIGQRVQLPYFNGAPRGVIEDVLAADTTYWYKIRIDRGGYATPGETWVQAEPERKTD